MISKEKESSMSVYEDRRHLMVESQLRTNKVTNVDLLKAFETTAKETFLDGEYAALAYIDEDLMLQDGRFILEPMVFARLVQALDLSKSDSVLDVGASCGYSTAILAQLAQSVVGIESNTDLSNKGQDNIIAAEIDNAVILQGQHKDGFSNEAPYNAIIIEGSVESVPSALLDQLADDGRLVTVLRDGPSSPGKAIKYVRAGDGFAHSILFDAQTPMLTEFAQEKAFSF
jgi:protein-L-isoaspartate(D-aspartate) O-methyltransferase